MFPLINNILMDNSKIILELEEFGFEKDQIELALKISTNKEEIIET